MRPKAAVAAALLPAVLALGGCITYPPGWDAERGSDPYEGINRSVFRFNDGLDRYVVGPVAHGWAFITPEGLRVALDKFFINLGFPARLFANLGQGKVKEAGSEFGRFLLNTTVGLVGFFDPATHIGMAFYDEDFGQMFGRWGIPAGPYWVVPFVGSPYPGPSNPRDAFGFLFDFAFNLRNLSPVPGPGLLAIINTRAIADTQFEAARESALDFYLFVRDASIQRRQALVGDLEIPEEGWAAEVDEELYDLDDEFDEEEEPGAMDEEAEPDPAADRAEREEEAADGAP